MEHIGIVILNNTIHEEINNRKPPLITSQVKECVRTILLRTIILAMPMKETKDVIKTMEDLH